MNKYEQRYTEKHRHAQICVEKQRDIVDPERERKRQRNNILGNQFETRYEFTIGAFLPMIIYTPSNYSFQSSPAGRIEATDRHTQDVLKPQTGLRVPRDLAVKRLPPPSKNIRPEHGRANRAEVVAATMAWSGHLHRGHRYRRGRHRREDELPVE